MWGGGPKRGDNTEEYFYDKIAGPQDLLISSFVSQIFLVTRLTKGLSLNDVKLKRGKRLTRSLSQLNTPWSFYRECRTLTSYYIKV